MVECYQHCELVVVESNEKALCPTERDEGEADRREGQKRQLLQVRISFPRSLSVELVVVLIG